MARLYIRLTPKAAAERIDGWYTDEHGRPVLKVRVPAAPIEDALVTLLADALNIPRSRLTLVRGDTARLKQVEIEGLTEAELLAYFA